MEKINKNNIFSRYYFYYWQMPNQSKLKDLVLRNIPYKESCILRYRMFVSEEQHRSAMTRFSAWNSIGVV